MTPRYFVLRAGFISAIAAVLVAGCSGGHHGSGSGTLEVKLTDAPGDVLELVVTIDRLSVKTAGSNGFEELELNTDIGVGGAVIDKDVVRHRLTIDLIQLANGGSLRLALGTLPAGRVEQIRLRIVEDHVQGTRTPWVLFDEPSAVRQFIKVPSGYQSGIKIVPRNVEIPAGGLVSITLDFDAAHSVVRLGGTGNRDFDFILKPVIFVLDASSSQCAATTLATGLNFPTGVDGLAGDDRLAVANGGTGSAGTSSNAKTVLTLALPTSSAPTDATLTDGSVIRSVLAAAPAGLRSSGASTFEAVAGDDLLHYVSGDPLVATGDTLGGPLTAVEPVAFNGGTAWFVARGGEVIFFAPPSAAMSLSLPGLVKVSGLAFVPALPAGSYGTLVVTDRGADPANPMDDRIVAAPLMTSGSGVALSGSLLVHTALTLDFLDEPVGVARTAAGHLLIAQRGNGFIHELMPDLSLIRICDTGLGALSLNGLAVTSVPALNARFGATELVLLPNTMGNDDPAADDPLDPSGTGGSTVEVVAP